MPVPCDIQYCLDGMSELHEISGDIYGYFSDFKENAINWWDENDSGRMSELIIADYSKWRKTAPLIEKAFLSYEGICQLKHQSHDLVLALANHSIENNPNPTKKEIASLLSSETEKTCVRFKKNLKRIITNAKEDFKNITILDIQDFIEAQEAKRRAFYAAEFNPTAILGPEEDWVEGNKKTKLYVIPKEERKIMTKSIKLLTDLFGKETAKIFLGREHVDVSGKKFNFKIKKKGSLSQTGWSALDIELYDKADVKLCNLCFYYDNMPPADQLIALMLDVQAGNEDIVVKTGNCFKVTADGSNNSDLAEIKSNPLLLKNQGNFPIMENQLLNPEIFNGFFPLGFPTIPKNFKIIEKRAQSVVSEYLKKNMKDLLHFDQKLIA